MENPFSFSNDKLRILLDSYYNWCNGDEKEKKYPKEREERAEHLRKTLLYKPYLAGLSHEELIKEIMKYSRTLEGPAHIALGEKRISAEAENVRRNLKYLIESSDEPFKKAAEILAGKYKIEYFSKAFWAPIFQALYPDTLPNWNKKTDDFLIKFGINLKTRKLSVEEKYRIISEAFRYLHNLDPRQNFHYLNHLMHYGTAVQGGVRLIDKLLKGKPVIEPPPRDILKRKIEKWKKIHVTEKRIEIRKKYEAKARHLLEIKCGKFNEKDLRQFFEFLNTDFWKDSIHHNRFGMAYTGKNLNALVDQLDETNRWILRIWKTHENELKAVLDEFYAQKPIKHAGTAFPSIILYLRNSSSFNLCFKRMEQGLESLTGYSVAGYSGDSYFNYNDKVNDFKNQYALQAQEIDIILCINENGGHFSTKTFQLLEQLHENPTRDFYQKYKEEFQKYLEEPFQQLFYHIASLLTPLIRNQMETEKKLFSRIIKNDFGKGGAWDFYWGALYPKGGKRISDPQLFLWINRVGLEFGFHIGEYGSDQRKRFIRNAQANNKVLHNILNQSLAGTNVHFGDHEDFLGAPKGIEIDESCPSLQDWLKNPEEAGVHASVFLPKGEVLHHSTEQLSDEIIHIYQALYPLILLAIYDDPLPAIADYIGDDQPRLPNPVYPLNEFAKNTCFDEASLVRWVRAIKRKGQVIIYGPPGTGKTYMAEHLARHLIGGGDGFSEIIQFHPAYAYEDFIQGIRPKAKGNGQLDYPVLPGRFLEFCDKAKRCTGLCVLIVDEINRANLARVFGELMYLLEYRDREVPLAGGGVFRIPDNVRIIGSMNTADRSIALVDHALRRRFAFLALYPDYEILKRYHGKEKTGFPVEGLIEILKELNGRIADRNYEIGVSFFLCKDLREQIEDIWSMEIEPYLEEYFFDQPAKIEEFRWAKIAKKILG